MGVALFIAMNLPLAAGAAVAARRVFGARGTLESFIAGALLFSFGAVAVMTCLGAAGMIGVTNAVLAGAVAAAFILIAGRTGGRVGRRGTGGGQGGGKSGKSEVRSPETEARSRDGGAADSMPGAGALVVPFYAVACAAVFILFVFAAITPPPATDALVYHLVFPAEWLKSGGIHIVRIADADQAASYSPGNVHLLYLWLMLPLHDDLLARFLEPAFFVVCLACCCGIARECGIGDRGAAAAACLSALVPGAFSRAANC
ncbi:MAG: hypothetical protein AB1742_04695, partial [bacterium]